MNKNSQKVLIVGAGVAGEELLNELRLHFKKQYQVVGFIDDDKTKIGKDIKGVKILGKIDELLLLIKKYSVDGILIAIPSAEGSTIRKILEACRGARVFFKIVPRTLEMVQGKVKLEQFRELKIEDLFGKAIVKKEQPIFESEFKDKTLIVVGAAGSIGSEICRQLIQFSPKKLIAFDWWENGLFELGFELAELASEGNFECMVGNMQDRRKVQDVIRKNRPDVIFHAAAFKHVPLMESHPLEAIRNNVFGTENLAKVAYEEGVEKFVYISTDKAASPQSVMGTTKLVGEHILASLNDLGRTKYCAVRFGNVMDSHGSVMPIFRKQIASGGPVTVTDTRMTRFMMTIPEAVQLVLHTSVIGRGGEIFVLDMGEQFRIDDLAKFMIQLAGFVPGEEIQVKYIGRRPGEKITEQLIAEDEYLEKTGHGRIFRVSQHAANIDLYDLADLRKAVESNNIELALMTLNKFVPNLTNHNSSNGVIPFSRTNIKRMEVNAVAQILQSGWLTMGEETVKFEEEFASYVGAKYAIAVNSCTAALFLSLKALGIKTGDEVIVPAFTFPATVSVIVHAGATPVFADINKENFCMDQKSLEKVITQKTKAVMPVHYGGNRAIIETDLPIIEDSAHLIPKNGDNTNSFTRCYSFYATKNMTTGEGGMITTNDEKVADWLRKARLHGLSRDAWKRYQLKSKWVYEVEFPGYKFNTTDINSALGRVQLARLDQFEQRRKEVVALYNELLGFNNKGTHLYPILVEKKRDEFFEYMKENGVGCSFHFLALNKEPAFAKYNHAKLPVTEYIASRVVTLPLDAVITDEEVEKVANLVKAFPKG
ncbi:aminotransferase class I/II-fold pyridoxal phosphate-dependent enzyme [Candidatus Microgenomates bacterium]|nr:aminotransferase class I/II-fold pyridoxal phosphate-dependent enzyme [Candidatus Microgenomates bacterium]